MPSTQARTVPIDVFFFALSCTFWTFKKSTINNKNRSLDVQESQLIFETAIFSPSSSRKLLLFVPCYYDTKIHHHGIITVQQKAKKAPVRFESMPIKNSLDCLAWTWQWMSPMLPKVRSAAVAMMPLLPPFSTCTNHLLYLNTQPLSRSTPMVVSRGPDRGERYKCATSALPAVKS